ncbi:MAG: ABC transporter permease subunit [Gemmatimonadota bacterium]
MSRAAGASSARTAARIAGYEARDVARGRWIVVYALLLLGVAQALVMLEADVVRAAAGLVNAALLVTPLVGLLFGALYMYGARDFNRLLLAQPVGRRELFGGLYAGVALPLVGAELLGLGLPLGIAALRQGAGFESVARLLLVVVALTLVSVALAFLVAVTIRDRAAGMGVAVLLWLGLTVFYDGLFASAAVALPDVLLEKPALALTLLNPVDTARILLLMEFDAAALLGYTGAVFRGFFGGATGIAVASGVLVGWIVLPLLAARRAFERADL